jgi:hypothetical protein
LTLGDVIMRVYCSVGLALGVALLTADSALAQRGGGFGGRGMGGGGAGGSDPTALIHNRAVQKDLNLTDEQIQKADEAMLAALGKVLQPEQAKRLEQISLQLKGSRAFAEPKVQSTLKLTDEQKESIKTILADSGKEMGDLAKGGRQGFQKVAALRKETMDKVTGVLTSSQRQQWQEMIGAEFRQERPTPGAGGGQRGKGRRPKQAAG